MCYRWKSQMKDRTRRHRHLVKGQYVSSTNNFLRYIQAKRKIMYQAVHFIQSIVIFTTAHTNERNISTGRWSKYICLKSMLFTSNLGQWIQFVRNKIHLKLHRISYSTKRVSHDVPPAAAENDVILLSCIDAIKQDNSYLELANASTYF